MQELSAERASHLIGLIYDCVADPGRWSSAVELIREALGLPYCVMNLLSLQSGEHQLVIPSGISPEWLAKAPLYEASILTLWGGVGRIMQLPLDEPVMNSEANDARSRQGNPWMEHWSKPQGWNDHIVVNFARDSSSIGYVCWGMVEEGVLEDTQRANLWMMAPHFRRAISISRLLDLKKIEADTLEAALDGLAPAIVLVGDDLGIVHANAAAKAMLRDRDPIGEAGGRLGLPHLQGTAALTDAVKRCAAGLVTLGQRGIGIPARQRDGSPALVHVLPLRAPSRTSGLSQRAVAAVFVAAAAAPPQMPAAALALLYDLTPAETRVLELIVEGKQPAEAAAHLGITLATVKTHLVRVFDKTGVNRQADLVRLVASLALPV